MAEVYPSDNELLNLSSEGETGVEYIETGKAPYYLEFRKLLYRLLEATKRANDLRVFDAGGLKIGVKAGKYWDGLSLCEYAGVSEVSLADDKEHIYVYLDGNGNLVTTEYSDWPVSSVSHIRLAEVVTSGGDVSSITDARGGHMWFMPGGVEKGRKTVVPVSLANLRAVSGNNIPGAASGGGLLCTDTSPGLEFIDGDTDSCLRLSWAAGSQNAVVFQVPLGADIDSSGSVEIHLRGASAGTTNAAGWDADCYFDEGNAKVEESAVQAAASSSYEELVISISSDDVPDGARTLTVELTPQGHTTEAMYLTAVWVAYTRS